MNQPVQNVVCLFDSQVVVDVHIYDLGLHRELFQLVHLTAFNVFVYLLYLKWQPLLRLI